MKQHLCDSSRLRRKISIANEFKQFKRGPSRMYQYHVQLTPVGIERKRAKAVQHPDIYSSTCNICDAMKLRFAYFAYTFVNVAMCWHI